MRRYDSNISCPTPLTNKMDISLQSATSYFSLGDVKKKINSRGVPNDSIMVQKFQTSTNVELKSK